MLKISSAFCPSSIEKAKLSREAEAIIKAATKEVKQLYYGLRSFWWDKLPKSEIFRDAKERGELQEYFIAPGYRQSDGSYSRDEFDTDAMNKIFWPGKRKEFYTQFEAEFGGIPEGANTTMKILTEQKRHILEVALDQFGAQLVNPDSDMGPIEQVRLALIEYNSAKLAQMPDKRDAQDPGTIEGASSDYEPFVPPTPVNTADYEALLPPDIDAELGVKVVTSGNNNRSNRSNRSNRKSRNQQAA